MHAGPLADWLEIVLIGEFRKRFAPIVADVACERAILANQLGQIRGQVVTAPLSKLLEKIAGPIRPVHFKAVAEYRVGRGRAERLHEPLASELEMMLDRGAIIVIQDEPFSI